MDYKKLKTWIILLLPTMLFVCIFSLFYINYNYQNNEYFSSEEYQTHKTNKKNNQEEIVVNILDTILPDKNEESIDSQAIKESVKEKKSVFEEDLTLQRENDSKKNIPSTRTKELDEKTVAILKQYILDDFYYRNDSDEALKIATECWETYIFTDEYRTFEKFILDVFEMEKINSMDDYDRQILIQKLHSPELILYTYLRLSSAGKVNVAENPESEIVDTIDILHCSFVKCKREGLQDSGAKNVYFITDTIEPYRITFMNNDRKCYLYYVRHKDNDRISILGLDDTTSEYCTVGEYKGTYN